MRFYMSEFKTFHFHYGENEEGKADIIATMLVSPSKAEPDPSGDMPGDFIQFDISRDKLKKIVKYLDDDFDKLARCSLNDFDKNTKL